MDVNATLEDMRTALADMENAGGHSDYVEAAERVAAAAVAIDSWIIGGGFLPDSWARKS